MNEYLFYYNETDPAKTMYEGSFIWYSRIDADTLSEAISEFEKYVSEENKIIQIIIKNRLH